MVMASLSLLLYAFTSARGPNSKIIPDADFDFARDGNF